MLRFHKGVRDMKREPLLNGKIIAILIFHIVSSGLVAGFILVLLIWYYDPISYLIECTLITIAFILCDYVVCGKLQDRLRQPIEPKIVFHLTDQVRLIPLLIVNLKETFYLIEFLVGHGTLSEDKIKSVSCTVLSMVLCGFSVLERLILIKYKQFPFWKSDREKRVQT